MAHCHQCWPPLTLDGGLKLCVFFIALGPIALHPGPLMGFLNMASYAALSPVAHPLVGMWALHCHIDLHANSGMLMAFKVAAPGAKEPWSLPKGITSCGAQNRWVQEEGGMLPCQPTPRAGEEACMWHPLLLLHVRCLHL